MEKSAQSVADRMEKVSQWCDKNGWALGVHSMRYGYVGEQRYRFKILWTGVELHTRCKASKSELLKDPGKPLSWKIKSIPADKIVFGRDGTLKLGSVKLSPLNS